MAGSPIRITILANARNALRNLAKVTRAVKQLDRSARAASRGGVKDLGNSLSGLGKILGKTTGALKVGGKALGIGIMGFVATGVLAGTAQVASALAAGLLATLPAVGVLPGFALAAASAFTVLKVATTGLSDAMTLGLKAALTGQKGDILAYNAAMAKLAPSAASAVDALVKLRPSLIKVRNAIADKFFAGLTAEIKGLAATYLPLLSRHGQKVAASMNHAAREVGGLFRQGSTVAAVGKIFGNVEKAIDNAASAVRPLIRGLLPLFTVSSSFLPGLTSGFRETAGRFADFMKQAEKSGALKSFIQGGLDALKSMFGLFKNIGSILKSVFVDANDGAVSFFGVIGTVIKQVAAFLNTAEGMKAVGSIWDGLRSVGESLGAALKKVLPALGVALGAIGPAIGPLADAMSKFLITLSPLLPVAGRLAAVFGGQLAGVFTTLGPVLLKIGTVAGALLTKLAPLITSVAKVAAIIGTALADAVDKLMPSLDPFVTALGGALVTAATAVAPLLPQIGVAFGQILTTVTPLLPVIAGLATTIATNLLPHIVPLTKFALALVVALKAYRVVTLACTIVSQAYTAAVKLNTAVVKVAQGVTAAFTGVQRGAAAAMAFLRGGIVATAIAQARATVAMVASKVATLAMSAAQKAAAAGMALIRGATLAWTGVQWLLNAALIANPIGLIVVGIAALIAIVVLIATKTTWFQTIWKVCWTAIKAAALFVFDFLKSYFSKMFAFYKSIFTAGVGAFKAIWAGILSIVDNVKAFRDRIFGILGGFLDYVLALPGKIINGLVNGLAAGWHKVTDFFKGAIELIPKGIRDALGIASPSKVLRKLGLQTGEGYGLGVKDSLPGLRKAMTSVAKTVTGGVATGTAVKLKADASITGTGAGAAALPPITINNYVANGVDPAEVGRKTVAAIEAWQKRNGRVRLLPA